MRLLLERGVEKLREACEQNLGLINAIAEFIAKGYAEPIIRAQVNQKTILGLLPCFRAGIDGILPILKLRQVPGLAW